MLVTKNINFFIYKYFLASRWPFNDKENFFYKFIRLINYLKINKNQLKFEYI